MTMWIFPKAPPHERGKGQRIRDNAKADYLDRKRGNNRRKKKK